MCRTGPCLGLLLQQKPEISFFWGKNPAHGVQVPARPDCRNYSVQHSAETSLQAAFFFFLGRKNNIKKLRKLLENKVQLLMWRSNVPSFGGTRLPGVGWDGKTAPKAQPPRPTPGSQNGVKPHEQGPGERESRGLGMGAQP